MPSDPIEAIDKRIRDLEAEYDAKSAELREIGLRAEEAREIRKLIAAALPRSPATSSRSPQTSGGPKVPLRRLMTEALVHQQFVTTAGLLASIRAQYPHVKEPSFRSEWSRMKKNTEPVGPDNYRSKLFKGVHQPVDEIDAPPDDNPFLDQEDTWDEPGPGFGGVDPRI